MPDINNNNGTTNESSSVVNGPDNPEPTVFGLWSFSADAGDLYDGQTTTRLEPQVAKLLAYFLSHQHKVVSRSELITAVWNNRLVTDDAINRCISILRHILSPQNKQAYIETVVRKGYIAHFPPPPAKPLPVVQPFRRHKFQFFAVVTCLAALFLYLALGKLGSSTAQVLESSSARLPVVAVLPFTSARQSSDSKFFAGGVHNDLLTQLSKLQAIRVISGLSVMEYANITHNIREIGKTLGADAILEGSVQIAANRIRINAQLIDTRTDQNLWAESYERELSPQNIFAVQSEIARTIAVQMNTSLTTQDNRQLALIPTGNMAAYRAYHRAAQLQYALGSPARGPKYIQALEEAVELDPGFSRAWAELVSALAFANFNGDKPNMTLRAERALEHLEAIAPGSADHLMAQAAYVYYALKDYDLAHDIISRALAMNPSSLHAVELKSWIERRQGDFNSFLASRREAFRLDPRNLAWKDSIIAGLILTHRYDEAWAEAEASAAQSFTAGYFQSLLLLREDQDFKSLQSSVQKLCQLYEEQDCGWLAYIANRDYVGAFTSLDKTEYEIEQAIISVHGRRQIFTDWLMKKDARLAKGLPQWQAQLEKDRDGSGGFRQLPSYLVSAMLAGVQGKPGEAVQAIERWSQRDPVDWAERANTRQEACRVLGMTGATHEAVKCIQIGLEEASWVMPFFEPYLPFYDSMREEAEFVKMLADIDRNET